MTTGLKLPHRTPSSSRRPLSGSRGSCYSPLPGDGGTCARPPPPRHADSAGRAQAQSAHPGPPGPRARSSRVTRPGVPPTLQLQSSPAQQGTWVGGGRGFLLGLHQRLVLFSERCSPILGSAFSGKERLDAFPQVILPQDSGVGPPLSGSGPADRLSRHARLLLCRPRYGCRLCPCFSSHIVLGSLRQILLNSASFC